MKKIKTKLFRTIEIQEFNIGTMKLNKETTHDVTMSAIHMTDVETNVEKIYIDLEIMGIRLSDFDTNIEFYEKVADVFTTPAQRQKLKEYIDYVENVSQRIKEMTSEYVPQIVNIKGEA